MSFEPQMYFFNKGINASNSMRHTLLPLTCAMYNFQSKMIKYT